MNSGNNSQRQCERYVWWINSSWLLGFSSSQFCQLACLNFIIIGIFFTTQSQLKLLTLPVPVEFLLGRKILINENVTANSYDNHLKHLVGVFFFFQAYTRSDIVTSPHQKQRRPHLKRRPKTDLISYLSICCFLFRL